MKKEYIPPRLVADGTIVDNSYLTASYYSEPGEPGNLDSGEQLPW